MTEVLHLDLGDRSDGPGPETGSARTRPSRRDVGLRAAAGLVALLVLAAAAPDTAPPSADDVVVTVSEAATAPGALGLDTVVLLLDVATSGPDPLELDVRSLDGALGPQTSHRVDVAPGHDAQVRVAVVPRCGDDVAAAADVAARSPSGQARLRVATDVVGEPFSTLCPPVEDGVHATATGLEVSGRSVRTRVVNHGTETVLVVAQPLVDALVADGSTVYLDPDIEVEPGTLVETRPAPVRLPVVVSSPILPVGLQPGEAVVVTLRVASRQCDVATDAFLQAQGSADAARVEGSDEVLSALLELVC